MTFAKPLDVVDFNKSCEEQRVFTFHLSGIPIYFIFLCTSCKFCFAPEFHHWSLADFEEKIYNDNYATVDPII